ncbi:type 2 isopentenyl-diphosphate Delta-isomerase [Aquisalinus flavus]|uniref:Isopentenyl-diphosphate delta-isomerase n=1 Tax=Aquisalinus flavus TaxID=1526572 RepID=A0A8J2V5X1_9PROT|nr:type 2 isopentenyl-diphosphate Delta-isomerase [Aquisalinus flavus]GGC98021.1 isopentenyl-diphosphate delta-isomerase [Aquisalinus flavus]
MSEIQSRKQDHIDIVLNRDVGFPGVTTGFEKYRFDHVALPELALDAVSLQSAFLGHTLALPFLISSMTGGPDKAEQINRNLAEAAAELKIAFAVGSQRVALEDAGAAGLGRALRDLAGTVPLIANLGAAQIRGADGPDLAARAADMIGADAVFIHLNPLQEAVQTGGDTDWTGVLSAIEAVATSGLTVAVKEVGFGISGRIARQLVDTGVSIIDVAGAGGTNWARVEAARVKDDDRHALIKAQVGAAFRNWGIPTAEALVEAAMVAPDATLIASGGIRDGIEAAMAIRLGASLAGQAAPALAPALQDPEKIVEHFTVLGEQLRTACFCTGSKDLAALRTAQLRGPDAP